MVGGRLYCLSCLFTSSAVLLLGVSLPDVEASICSNIIHKKVGDTVELSPCLPPDTSGQLIVARWRKGDKTIADKDQHGSKLSDKFYLNPTNLSLIVRKLTPQDSGIFSFTSEVNERQLATVTITLQVHAPITQQPDVQVNSTWVDFNKSCIVLLKCSSTSDRNVNYSWSVRNQTHGGSRLQFTIRPEDGETTFTCTISDSVSEMSASETRMCNNSTESIQFGPDNLVLLSTAVRSCTVIAITLGTAVGVCCCRRKVADYVGPDPAESCEENIVTLSRNLEDNRMCSFKFWFLQEQDNKNLD